MKSIPEKMSAVLLTGHGGYEKLVLRDDIPVPQPGPKDVLIKVSAAGVNNTDVNTRIGWYSKSKYSSEDASWTGAPLQLPRIQGADVCGKVVAIGSDTDEDLLNSRVLVEPCIREAGGRVLESPWYFGSECDGGFAEYTLVAARHAHKINSRYTDIELASFPCSYSTAENLLDRSQVTANDTVLVTGASGGVGSAVIQLAKARGATVLGVSSPSKTDKLRQLGASGTLTRDENIVAALGKNSIDVVIDLVAGKNWSSLLTVLRPFGRYAASGAIAGPYVELDVRTLYLKDLSLYGCTIPGEHVFRNLITRIENEEIKPLVDKIFPLDQIVEAQKYFEQKKHVGKVVLDLSNTY